MDSVKRRRSNNQTGNLGVAAPSGGQGQTHTTDLQQNRLALDTCLRDHERQYIAKQQRWLLYLRHVSSCTEDPGQCSVGQACRLGKDLFNHILECSETDCQYPRCVSTRVLLQHHQGCISRTCAICTPVKQYVQRQRQLQQQAIRAAVSSSGISQQTCVTTPQQDSSSSSAKPVTVPANQDQKIVPKNVNDGEVDSIASAQSDRETSEGTVETKPETRTAQSNPLLDVPIPAHKPGASTKSDCKPGATTKVQPSSDCTRAKAKSPKKCEGSILDEDSVLGILLTARGSSHPDCDQQPTSTASDDCTNDRPAKRQKKGPCMTIEIKFQDCSSIKEAALDAIKSIDSTFRFSSLLSHFAGVITAQTCP